MANKTEAVTLHGFPSELVRDVEKYAKELAGGGARPSKGLAFADLVRKGLGVVRGDAPGGTRRGE